MLKSIEKSAIEVKPSALDLIKYEKSPHFNVGDYNTSKLDNEKNKTNDDSDQLHGTLSAL